MKKLRKWLKKWLYWKEKYIISIKKTHPNTILHRVITAYVQWCLYTRCKELPLNRFIRCICNSELKALKKRGFLTKKILAKTWALLTEEYARLSGDTIYQKSFLLSKEIARENGKLTLIRACLHLLSFQYSKKCILHLNDLGYHYPFKQEDPVGFRRDMEKVRRKARMISISLKEKRKQYEKLTHTENRIPTEVFTRTLILLSKYMGHRINPAQVTVEEYIIMQKQYEREIQAHTSLKNKKERIE